MICNFWVSLSSLMVLESVKTWQHVSGVTSTYVRIYTYSMYIYIYISNARIFSSMVACLNLEYITLHLWKRTHMHASLKWFQCWFDLDDELLRALDAIDSTKECHINENKPIVVEYTYVHIPIDHYRSIYLPIHLPNRYIFTCPIHTYIHTCMHACIHTYIQAYRHTYIYSLFTYVYIYIHFLPIRTPNIYIYIIYLYIYT